MQGYSVQEAAEVLGIPQGRVWELIARGVLAGTPEGADVRVLLRPSAPTPGAAFADPPGGPSPSPGAGPGAASSGALADTAKAGKGGNGGSGTGSHAEATPFRELLTEFRNLTERYGQALLALGEARGEVAALRSRVELLEARMDLQLPAARPTSTVAWELPDRPRRAAPSRPAPEPAQDSGKAAEVEPEEQADLPQEAAAAAQRQEAAAAAQQPEVEAAPPSDALPEADEGQRGDAAAEARQRRSESRRKRLRTGRAALVGIAEALARAEDPALPELPGAREAADALAALRDEAAEPSVPGAMPSFAETESAMAEVPPETEPPMMEAEEPQSIAEAAPAPTLDSEELLRDETAIEPAFEPARGAETYLPAPAPSAGQDAAPAPAVPPEEAPSTESRSIYTTEVVEPDWFADGDFTWLDAADQGRQEDKPSQTDQPSQAEVTVEAPGEAAAEAGDTEEEATPAISEDAAVARPESPMQAGPAFRPLFADEASSVSPPPEATPEPHAGAEPEMGAIQDAWQPEAEPAEQRDDAAPPTAPIDEATPEPHAGAEPEMEAIQDAWQPEAEPAEQRDHAPAPAAPIDEPASPTDAPEVAREPTPEPHAGAEPEMEAIQDAWQPEAEPAEQRDQASAAEAPTEASVRREQFGLFRGQPAGGRLAPAAEGPSPSAESRPASSEEELMRLGEEFDAAELEVAAPGWHRGSSRDQESSPLLELSDDDLSRLAANEGWDPAEVDAIRSFLGRSANDAPPSPQGGAASPPPGEPPPSPNIVQVGSETATETPSPDASAAVGEPPQADRDAQWRKARRGPAATAYRRLRRLFQG